MTPLAAWLSAMMPRRGSAGRASGHRLSVDHLCVAVHCADDVAASRRDDANIDRRGGLPSRRNATTAAPSETLNKSHRPHRLVRSVSRAPIGKEQMMIAEPLANPIVRKLLIYIAAFVVGAGAIIAIDN